MCVCAHQETSKKRKDEKNNVTNTPRDEATLGSGTATILFWIHHGSEIAFLIFVIAGIIFQYQAIVVIPGAEEVATTTTVTTTTTILKQSMTSCLTHPCTITVNISDTIGVTAVVAATLTRPEWLIRMQTAQTYAQISGYLALASGLISFLAQLLERRRGKRAKP
mgnify:CR=1 FL=1